MLSPVDGSVSDAAEPCYHTDQPFLEQLIRATVVGDLTAARLSPTVMLLLGDDQIGRPYLAAEASELWRKNLVENVGQRITAAVTAGEVRDDVAVETMARWVTRWHSALSKSPVAPKTAAMKPYCEHFCQARYRLVPKLDGQPISAVTLHAVVVRAERM